MSPAKHAQRDRGRTSAKALRSGRHVHRMGKTYMRIGFISDDGVRSQGFWLLCAGRNDEIFYNDDWSPRPHD